MSNPRPSTLHLRAAWAAVLVAGASACATPAPQRRGDSFRGARLPRADVERGTVTVDPEGPGAPRVDGPDPTEAFRDALDEASTVEARRDVTERAVGAALEEERGAEAARFLLWARKDERDAGLRSDLEARVLELIDERISPVGLRLLLEETEPGRFPHEHVLFKLALLQLHAGDRVAGADTLAQYASRYPSGLYLRRAEEWTSRLAARDRVEAGTIGVLLPLSGPKGAYGRLARQALELAFEGSRVRLVVADTKDDEATTSRAVERLVLEEGAIALLGPVFRTESRAAAVMAQRLGIALLTISAAEDVSSYGPWIFRNGVTNRAQAETLVRHAMEILGHRTFAILHPRHPYGEELRDLFWDEVSARGGEIRGIESYAVDATTFSDPVKRLVGRDHPERREDFRLALQQCQQQPDSYRRARCAEQARKDLRPLVDFDGLFIPDYARSVRMIAAALAAEDIIVEQDPGRLRVIERTLGRTPKVVTLLGASGWNSEKITDSTGRTVENAVFTDGFFPSADDERIARFVGVYRERFGRTPRLYPEALIYDSARILRSIIESQRPADRLGLREALRAVVDFPGVTGETSFAGKTEATKRLKILTIADGQIVEVPRPDALPPPAGASASP